MRTAIFVYQTTPINISTSEDDLQLCCMSAGPVTLAHGDNPRSIVPGIYKIVSRNDVDIFGDDNTAFDVVTVNNKDDDPTLPPKLASEVFAPLDVAALQAFLVIPDAKQAVNP